MTLTDWFIDLALLLIVFRQLREGRLTARTFVIPLALIAWVITHYLHAVPTSGNDAWLIAGFTAVGVVFGLVGGLVTRVRFLDGTVMVKATVAAATLWVVSMGFRLGFAVWSSHTSGATDLRHFSAIHDITSAQAWVAALVLMACSEVVVRLGTIALRGRAHLNRHGGSAPHGTSMLPKAPAGHAS
jgi:hypothetical protein